MMTTITNRLATPRALCTVLLTVSLMVGVAAPAGAGGLGPFEEMIERSLAEKKSLIIYVNGQTIPAIVTKIIDDDAIEVRNREYDRIVIRVDRIDAVAGN